MSFYASQTILSFGYLSGGAPTYTNPRQQTKSIKAYFSEHFVS